MIVSTFTAVICALLTGALMTISARRRTLKTIPARSHKRS